VHSLSIVLPLLSRLLTLPSDTRARHKVTTTGREEAAHVHVIHAHLLASITVRMGRMAELCEVIKREGLPPNEVSKFNFTFVIVIKS
jgi:hypothetical protein